MIILALFKNKLHYQSKQENYEKRILKCYFSFPYKGVRSGLDIFGC